MMIVRIKNKALETGLTSNELKVYVYIAACSNRLNNAVVKIDTICEDCCIQSRSTVTNAINGLQGKGLIHKYNRRNYEGNYIANGYTVASLPGGWFSVDTQQMQLFRLDKASFHIYMYLLKTKRSSSNKVFSSLNRISRKLRVCKNTVIKALRELVRLCFIRKDRPPVNGRSNLYALFSQIEFETDYELFQIQGSETSSVFDMLATIFLTVKTFFAKLCKKVVKRNG